MDYHEFGCDNCNKKIINILQCSKCKFSRYCNKECQKNHWITHKKQCTQLLEISITMDRIRGCDRLLHTICSIAQTLHNMCIIYHTLSNKLLPLFELVNMNINRGVIIYIFYLEKIVTILH